VVVRVAFRVVARGADRWRSNMVAMPPERQGISVGIREAERRYEQAELRVVVAPDQARTATAQLVSEAVARARENGYDLSVPQVALFAENVMLLSLGGVGAETLGDIIEARCPPPLF
jgi:hypothetical protein